MDYKLMRNDNLKTKRPRLVFTYESYEHNTYIIKQIRSGYFIPVEIFVVFNIWAPNAYIFTDVSTALYRSRSWVNW